MACQAVEKAPGVAKANGIGRSPTLAGSEVAASKRGGSALTAPAKEEAETLKHGTEK
jgi:hypothetical protein